MRTTSVVVTVTLALTLGACAHSQSIKRISKEQEALLGGLRKAVGDVRDGMRTSFDETIADYKRARLGSFLASETRSIATRIEGCLKTPAACGGRSLKKMLDEAALYLVAAEGALFSEGFCAKTWEPMKLEWMRRPGERCLTDPQQRVASLQRGRDVIDGALAQLAAEIATVEKGHALLDRFLQVKIEIREEDVKAAKEAIESSRKALGEVKKTLDGVAADPRR